MRLRSTLALCIAVLLAGTLEVSAQTPERVRVACIGDSITAGDNVSTGEAYPAQLQGILGDTFEVKNFGVSGATLLRSGTPNAWQQWSAIEAFAPNVAVILLGTNDTVGPPRNNWAGTDKFEEDYQKLISELASLPTAPRIFLCTPTPIVLDDPGLSETRRAELTERHPRLQNLCERIEALALRDPAVSWIDVARRFEHHLFYPNGEPTLFDAGDGVHPNAKGYAVLARTVALFVKASAKQTNIVLFMADDLGWNDTEIHRDGSTQQFNRPLTPNVRRLRMRGTSFPNAYASAPVCTPTRTSLLTGRSPGQTRITYWTLHEDRDTSRPHDRLAAPAWRMNGLNGDDVTMPQLFRDAGYRTIHVGKAHLAAHDSEGDDMTLLGFDVNIAGHASGAPASYYGEHDFSAAGKSGNAEGKPAVWDVPGLEKYHGKDIFLTEALQAEACREMREAVEAEEPFFLHFAPYAVHTPIMANERYLENYPNMDPTEAAYATMVQSVDAALGAILETLEELEIRENTVIVFTSDNGGLSAVARGGLAHTHNAPLRSGKGSAYEGGTRVPLVITWPGVSSYRTYFTPIVSHDLFPTLLSAGGVEIASALAEEIEGRDFSSKLSVMDAPVGFGPIFWNQPHQWGATGPGIEPFTSIVEGPHKLIYFHSGPRFELYHLREDVGETRNLVDEKPSTVKWLAEELDTWIQTYDVQLSIDKETGEPIPLPGEAFAKARYSK